MKRIATPEQIETLSAPGNCRRCGCTGYEAANPDGELVDEQGSGGLYLPDDCTVLCATADGMSTLACGDCVDEHGCLLGDEHTA